MKTIIVILLGILGACASRKPLDTYGGWDRNSDAFLDRTEFELGYARNKYFGKWSGDLSTSYKNFYNTVFSILDDNHDARIVRSEFDPYMKHFYFNMLSDSFEKWDTNGDRGINATEYVHYLDKNELAPMWDVTGDKSITSRELAAGMFNVADTNNDNRVTEIEYNLWKVSR